MTSADEPQAQPSFQQAMEITVQWLAQWEAGEISDEVLADRVAELVASRDGARGFFVMALAGDSPLLDRHNEPLLFRLRQGGSLVVDLTVRNLAMSTAMALAHGRTGDHDQQAGSLRVQARATELLRQLEPQAVRDRLETLLAAARLDSEEAEGGADADKTSSAAKVNGLDEDRVFLRRWGYDPEQCRAIISAIEAVAERA